MSLVKRQITYQRERHASALVTGGEFERVRIRGAEQDFLALLAINVLHGMGV